MGRNSTLRLEQIFASRSQDELKIAALLAAQRLGFDYFAFLGSFLLHRAPCEVSFDNLPESWRRHCVDRERDLLPSPLRRLALQEVTPLMWSSAAPEHARSFAKAREHGLATGVSCSVRGPRGEWSVTSFALPRGDASAERHIAGALPDCQLIACGVHFAATRAVGRSPDRASPFRRFGNGLLSERERQCLMESARGKTTAEIALALQISERTVAFHLANARRKLDAANSRHAVTKALSLRLIAAG
jgi:LuxR family transcriptional regulator, activator of conjugal transfer of Ti plasmids